MISAAVGVSRNVRIGSGGKDGIKRPTLKVKTTEESSRGTDSRVRSNNRSKYKGTEKSSHLRIESRGSFHRTSTSRPDVTEPYAINFERTCFVDSGIRSVDSDREPSPIGLYRVISDTLGTVSSFIGYKKSK